MKTYEELDSWRVHLASLRVAAICHASDAFIKQKHQAMHNSGIELLVFSPTWIEILEFCEIWQAELGVQPSFLNDF